MKKKTLEISLHKNVSNVTVLSIEGVKHREELLRGRKGGPAAGKAVGDPDDTRGQLCWSLRALYSG